MRRYISLFGFAILAVAFAFRLGAESVPSALAQLGPGKAEIVDSGGTVILSVPMSQPVAWTVGTRNGPPRVVVEFGDLVWSKPPSIKSESVAETRVNKTRPGWSELALVLREPLAVGSAEMDVAEDGTARLEVRLLPTTADEFHKSANPDAADYQEVTISSDDRVVVAIDPGHGGFDPGALAGEVTEADLMLAMARRFKEALIRTGRFDAVLTRDEDVFVPLETRLTRARQAGADVFLSLHADALASEDGKASGMSVYRLAEDAEGAANALLTERHSGADLLSGVDLTDRGDDVALALLDVVRRDTAPRAKALQRSLVAAFRSADLAVNSRPEREGTLSVLKSAEIPSVLVELGFLSSEKDRERLSSEAWQATAATALAEGLMLWQDEDRLMDGAKGQ